MTVEARLLSRRYWLASAGMLAATALATPPRAARSQTARTLKIGVLTDLSGQYADFYGEGSVLAARMAVEDAGNDLLGLPVEILVADHQNKPDVGAAIARQWFSDQGVLAVADVPSSAVGLAVNGIARDANRVFLASGPFTTEITGPSCSPNTVQWTTDNWAIGNSIGRSIVSEGGMRWFFVTADFAFGYDLEANTRRAILAQGGAVLGSVRHPFGTADLSSYLLQAQASGADVIALANAGSDFNNAVKQAREFGIIGAGVRLAGLATVINNVHSLGLDGAQGLYATAPFYWDLDEATRTWAARFGQRHSKHAMPNEMQAGTYAVVLHYLKALGTLGRITPDGREAVAAMKALPTEDPLFKAGSIRADGRKLHAMHLLHVKTPDQSHRPWDYFNRVRTVPAEEAFRPLDRGGCPLVRL